jgi:nucleotide-binding universal stress UspA family protein
MRAHTFETILVPVDFSEISAHALRTASLLAARCGRAKIIAMYANWFEAPPYFTVGRLAELQAEFSESLHLAKHSLEAFVHPTVGRAQECKSNCDGYPRPERSQPLDVGVGG